MYSTAQNMCITRMSVGAGNPFMVISNNVASYSRDNRLSSSAKGILLTIFALPDKNWHFSVKGLSLLMKDSEDKIRSTLKELKKLGYYAAEKNKDEKGRYRSTRYCFYETAQLHAEEDAGEENGLFSLPYPHRENPDVDSAVQLNTNKTNTDLLNTKSVCRLTESVCPADKHKNQKSGAVSEDGTFTVTDEMRNRVQNALYGENKEEICHFTEDTTVPEMEESVEKRKSVSLPVTFRCAERYRSIWFPDYA